MKISNFILAVLYSLSVLSFNKVESKKHTEHKNSSQVSSKIIGWDMPRPILEYNNCFKAKNGYTFQNIWLMFIKEKFKVNFYLITRNNGERVPILKSTDLSKTDLDVSRKTVFIVHGFSSSGSVDWIYELTHAFLEWDDVNVIIVDWSGGASLTNLYEKAANNTQITGRKIYKFIKRVVHFVQVTQPEKKFGKIHFVGHSLGAHTTAIAADNLKVNNIPWEVERITGLDPAGPCFFDADDKFRLDKSDAPFVDVVHTNIDADAPGFGMPDQIGHIDFYPNGGARQPGCEESSYSLFNMAQMSCNHGRSYMYLTDSLRQALSSTCTFKAFKWSGDWTEIPPKLSLKEMCEQKDCIPMGIEAEKYKHTHNGSFFTVTASKTPFCKIHNVDLSIVRSIVKIKKRLNQSLQSMSKIRKKN